MADTTIKTLPYSMKTPKEFTNNIKNGIVTMNMLGACIYSVNKRAKNYRDNIKELNYYSKKNKYWYDKYDNKGKYEEKMNEYYSIKDELLNFISPIEIHKVIYCKDWYDYEYQEWTTRSTERYFTFFKCDNYTFHHPIEENEISNYNLETKEIDLETYGESTEELLSVQCVTKILNGLKNKSLILINTNN